MQDLFCEPDLGVIITPDLKWVEHIKVITGQAYGVLNFIRTFENLDKENFSLLYKSLVRPQLEYCIQARFTILPRRYQPY